MRFKNNIIFSLLAIVTVIAFFFFRFYQIEHRVIFDFDQEDFSRSVAQILQQGDLTLIGPRVLSDKGFFLGPYFIYALVPFYLLSNLHPWGLIYFLITYNILFFILAAKLITKLWSKYHAVFFLLAWATNSLIVRYDTTPWNPISIPIGVMLVWYLLHKIIQNNRMRYWLLLGLTYGLFLNQHFQFVFLMVFGGIFVLLAHKEHTLLSAKRIAIAASGFLFTYVPLFLFDIRHNFLNARLFLSFFTEDVSGTAERGRFLWIQTYSTVFQPIIGYRDPILAITFFILLAICLLYMTRRSEGYKSYFYKSALIMWMLLPGIFALYNKRMTDYYIISLYPFIYITLIDILLTTRRYILLTIMLIIGMYVNYSLFLLVVRPNPLGMYQKDRAIQIMKSRVKENVDYNISFDMPPGLTTGYFYLLDWHKVRRVDKPGIPLIEFNNPKKDGDVDVNTDIGIKIPKEVRK